MNNHFRLPTRAELLRRIDEVLKFYDLYLVKPWNENKKFIDGIDLLKLLDLAVYPTRRDPHTGSPDSVALFAYILMCKHIGIEVQRKEARNDDQD